jgi:hypothetical protein
MNPASISGVTVSSPVAWNKGNRHGDALGYVHTRMADVCAKLPAADPARAACDSALRPAKSTPT